MSIYLKRKEDNILKAAKQFITINPTTDEVSKFFQCQKSIDHDFDLSKFSIYFNNVNKYLQSSENSYISYFSVNYIIKEKVSIDLDSAISIIKSLLFELKTVDIESDKYGQIETTISSFISNIHRTNFYRRFFHVHILTFQKLTNSKKFYQIHLHRSILQIVVIFQRMNLTVKNIMLIQIQL